MNMNTVVMDEETLLLERQNGDKLKFDGNDKRILKQKNLTWARRILYASHAFAQASEISWQFCLTIFLAAFTNYRSLFLVSSYGLLSGFFTCVASGHVGKFVDRAPRLYVARALLISQNICVVFATVCSFLLLLKDSPSSDYLTSATATATTQDDMHMDNYTTSGIDDTSTVTWLSSRLQNVPLDRYSVILFICVHILGVTADVLDKAFKVAIEKDWVVVLSDEAASCGEKKSLWLRETNVAMKQIDLSCKVIAPALAGGLVATGNLRFAAVAVGVLNFLSVIVEYSCTEMIYKVSPGLASKNASARQDINGNCNSDNLAIAHNQNDNDTGNGNGNHTTNGDEVDVVAAATKNVKLLKEDGMLRTYFQQPIAAGGLALSLLYLNILSFGSIMTAYLVFRGVRMDVIGTLRGISCAIGLLGTVAFHFSAARMSLEATGLWAIVFQFTCLSLSYYSLYVTDNYWSLFMLISGVCASRIGLWVFDISISQLMQEKVAEEVRGVVGGVQNSMNAMFGLLAYGLGMFFPDPREFHIYVVMGFIAVGLAMLLWFFGVYLKTRQK